MTSSFIYMFLCTLFQRHQPGVVLKKNGKCVKKLPKLMGMLGIDNRLLVSPSKKHKIPKNI